MSFSRLYSCFEKIDAIDYNHSEGGRYAYVQMMAFVRELNELLLSMGLNDSSILSELEHTSELLNQLVPLRFEESHKLIFEDRRRLIREMKSRVLLNEAVAA